MNHRLTAPLLAAACAVAVLAAPAALAAPPEPSPATRAAQPRAGAPESERIVKGLRFLLPKGFKIEERFEKEQGEELELMIVASRGAVEVHAEVEDGTLDCSKEFIGGTPRNDKDPAGRARCQNEGEGPPAMGDEPGPRKAAKVELQFPDRHLSVVVFAPTAAEALKLAHQVAASAAEAAPLHPGP